MSEDGENLLWHRACAGKKRFETPRAAFYHARNTRKRIGDTNIRHYQCKNCGGWHIGHFDEKKTDKS